MQCLFLHDFYWSPFISIIFMVHFILMVSEAPERLQMCHVHVQYYVFWNLTMIGRCVVLNERVRVLSAVHLLIHSERKEKENKFLVFLAHANKIMFLKWWFIIHIYGHFLLSLSLVSQVINQIGFNRNKKTSRIAALGFRYNRRAATRNTSKTFKSLVYDLWVVDSFRLLSYGKYDTVDARTSTTNKYHNRGETSDFHKNNISI